MHNKNCDGHKILEIEKLVADSNCIIQADIAYSESIEDFTSSTTLEYAVKLQNEALERLSQL